jgi:hypothetical protein
MFYSKPVRNYRDWYNIDQVAEAHERQSVPLHA